jgi:hypothetical protein
MGTGPLQQFLGKIRTLLEGRSAEPTDDVALLQRFVGSDDPAAF